MQYYELRIMAPVPDELIQSGEKEFLRKYLHLCCTEAVDNAVKDLQYSQVPAEKGRLTRRELLLDYIKREISAMSDRELYDLYEYSLNDGERLFSLCEWCRKKTGVEECPDTKCPKISEFLQEEI